MKTKKKIDEIEIDITREDVDNFINEMSNADKIDLIKSIFSKMPKDGVKEIDDLIKSIVGDNFLITKMVKNFIKNIK